MDINEKYPLEFRNELQKLYRIDALNKVIVNKVDGIINDCCSRKNINESEAQTMSVFLTLNELLIAHRDVVQYHIEMTWIDSGTQVALLDTYDNDKRAWGMVNPEG